MKSPFSFIVKPFENKRYSNTKKIGSIDFIVSTSIEDHKFSNRYAEVLELPIGYKGPIQVGNILLVHHNVFKYYNDIKGKQQSGKSFFQDNKFFVEEDQFFMYKNKNGWNAYNKYCFVEPSEVEESYIYKPISKEPLVGIMKYPNEYLKKQGIKNGTKVSFKPESEYEFIIDDKTYYRIYDHQITLSL